MAADNQPNEPISEAKLAQLAEKYRLEDNVSPPTPVATDGFFWKLVDTLGPWAAVGAAVLAALVLLLGWLGGESFAWASILYIPVTLLLLLYIPYLLRRRQQEKAAAFLLRQQAQEKARLEIARLVLEQSRKEQEK